LVNIDLLSEIKEKSIRSLYVNVDVDELNQQQVDEIISLTERFPGRHNLKFRITDTSQGYKVPLRSKKYKISLDQNLIFALKQIPFLEIQIN
jgi:hypothetical protein